LCERRLKGQATECLRQSDIEIKEALVALSYGYETRLGGKAVRSVLATERLLVSDEFVRMMIDANDEFGSL